MRHEFNPGPVDEPFLSLAREPGGLFSSALSGSRPWVCKPSTATPRR